MVYGTEQEKEIATIRERNIKVELSDADCERIAELCGKHNLTVGQLIKNFIGDLVDGTYSNGSDERDMAEQWFNRCWFGMFPDETLLSWFLNQMIDIDDFLTVVDEMNYAKEHPEEYKDEEKKDGKFWFEQEYDDYVSEFLERNKDADMEKEIEEVRKWYKEKESFVHE